MIRRIRRFGVAMMSTCVLAACGDRQEPAHHAVDDVRATLEAAAPQSQKYLPDQYAAIHARSVGLEASYDHGNYRQVLNDAPTLLNDIQAMAAAGAARKAAADKVLAGEWKVLAGSIPDRLSAVQERLDQVANDKKEAARLDVAGAKQSLTGVDEQWSQAQEAFNANDLNAATDAAKAVQRRIDAAARALKVALPETAH